MKYLEFIPAELNEIMGQYGFRWPKHLPMAASGGEYRSFEAICAWHDVVPSELPFQQILEVLVNGSLQLRVTRISRRKYLDSWQLYEKVGELPLVAFSQSSGAMISITWFEAVGEFWQWLAGDYQQYELPEIPLRNIPYLSKQEWGLQLALCDFFLRSYPVPNADWTADQLLVFSIESLREDMKHPEGWTVGWGDLLPLPDLTDSALEEMILMWCNQGRLGEIEMADGSKVYMVGREWTWLLRSMAWWDGGFILQSTKYPQQKLFILQASALWLLIQEGDVLEAAAIDGNGLWQILDKYAGASASPAATHPAFCPKCGKPTQPEDLFCRFCGTSLA